MKQLTKEEKKALATRVRLGECLGLQRDGDVEWHCRFFSRVINHNELMLLDMRVGTETEPGKLTFCDGGTRDVSHFPFPVLDNAVLDWLEAE